MLEIEGKLRDFPEVGLVRCQFCGLVNPAEDLQRHVAYDQGTMHSWASGWGTGRDRPSEDVPRRLREVASYLPKKSAKFLDIGCGDGSFLRSVSSLTPEVYGVDPDVHRTLEARRGGMKICPSLDDLGPKQFDVITLIHTVEHFYDVVGGLEEIRSFLKPEGRLLIETPNANDALITKYSSRAFSTFTFWSHHPNLCTNKFLEEALLEAGFQVEISSQVQRYGLANHLYWLSNEAPGGHSAWASVSNPSLDAEYEKQLVSSGTADTIWIVASPSK